jgi:hypothetical protein
MGNTENKAISKDISHLLKFSFQEMFTSIVLSCQIEYGAGAICAAATRARFPHASEPDLS